MFTPSLFQGNVGSCRNAIDFLVNRKRKMSKVTDSFVPEERFRDVQGWAVYRCCRLASATILGKGASRNGQIPGWPDNDTLISFA